jgi:hypothetical protein
MNTIKTFFSLLISTAFNLGIGLCPMVYHFAHTGSLLTALF